MDGAPMMEPSLDAQALPVQVGQVVAGKYTVERFLARGGAGVVFRARHVHLLEPCAIKFMLPRALGTPMARERFLREARACARLKGDHVVRVFDVGELDAETPYMVLEYLEGMDLEERLAQQQAPPRRRGGGLRPPDLRRPGRGARGRHRPPRPQAGQRLPHAARRRHDPRQDPRLRHLEGPLRRPRRPPVPVPDRGRHPRRLAALHGARAGARRRDRHPRRPLGGRRHPLLPRDRRLPLPGPEGLRHHGAHPPPRAGAAVRARPHHPCQAREDHPPVPGEGPGPPPRERGRARGAGSPTGAPQSCRRRRRPRWILPAAIAGLAAAGVVVALALRSPPPASCRSLPPRAPRLTRRPSRRRRRPRRRLRPRIRTSRRSPRRRRPLPRARSRRRRAGRGARSRAPPRAASISAPATDRSSVMLASRR